MRCAKDNCYNPSFGEHAICEFHRREERIIMTLDDDYTQKGDVVDQLLDLINKLENDLDEARNLMECME